MEEGGKGGEQSRSKHPTGPSASVQIGVERGPPQHYFVRRMVRPGSRAKEWSGGEQEGAGGEQEGAGGEEAEQSTAQKARISSTSTPSKQPIPLLIKKNHHRTKRIVFPFASRSPPLGLTAPSCLRPFQAFESAARLVRIHPKARTHHLRSRRRSGRRRRRSGSAHLRSSGDPSVSLGSLSRLTAMGHPARVRSPSSCVDDPLPRERIIMRRPDEAEAEV